MTTEESSVEEIERQINDLKKRWPKHTPPPAMMEELDELEAALERAQKRLAESGQDPE